MVTRIALYVGTETNSFKGNRMWTKIGPQIAVTTGNNSFQSLYSMGNVSLYLSIFFTHYPHLLKP